MSKRISCLAESPCYQCGVGDKCLVKVARCQVLGDIVDYVMPNAEFDYHDCSIYKSLVLEANILDNLSNI